MSQEVFELIKSSLRGRQLRSVRQVRGDPSHQVNLLQRRESLKRRNVEEHRRHRAEERDSIPVEQRRLDQLDFRRNRHRGTGLGGNDQLQ